MREVDWPKVKSEMVAVADSGEERRRGFMDDSMAFEWRVYVAKVYVSRDLDFCPLGVQTVHTVDVLRRVAEFNALDLAEVFESQCLHFTSRIPMFLAALSGWPIFKLYGLLAETARGMPDFPFSSGALLGSCGGSVDFGEVLSVVRGLFDKEEPTPWDRLLTQLGFAYGL
ncbi:unnamed protein product, partial [Polarella glacialis]